MDLDNILRKNSPFVEKDKESEFQQHDKPLYRGLPDTFPSFQDQVGKLSTGQEKTAKTVSALHSDGLVLLDDECVSKAQSVSLSHNWIYF